MVLSLAGIRARRAALLAALLLGAFVGQIRASAAPVRVFVPVLIHHHVKWDRPGDDAIERGLTIPPTQFKGEVLYLRSHGYHTVSAAALVSFLRGGPSLPAKPVVLTFDDGYRDMASNVYPLLRRYHMTATFFVVPGLLGQPRYLTWSQVMTMRRGGMDIEPHSMSHPDLTVVPPAQAWGEVSDSRRVLAERLHVPARVFAYPYGSYNAAILNDVRKAGYWGAFTTLQGWWQQSSELLTLPRVYVDRDDTLPIFAGRLVADPHVLAQDPT
jgi:peptidoglycan/xylan/chitin deacetylase (PgdA/CDA1 family)